MLFFLLIIYRTGKSGAVFSRRHGLGDRYLQYRDCLASCKHWLNGFHELARLLAVSSHSGRVMSEDLPTPISTHLRHVRVPFSPNVGMPRTSSGPQFLGSTISEHFNEAQRANNVSYTVSRLGKSSATTHELSGYETQSTGSGRVWP
jgi:hypothetical protein